MKVLLREGIPTLKTSERCAIARNFNTLVCLSDFSYWYILFKQCISHCLWFGLLKKDTVQICAKGAIWTVRCDMTALSYKFFFALQATYFGDW